jgi:gamma-glutamyl:cysteine ligase YbdK (ATP-grasp superfamily)
VAPLRRLLLIVPAALCLLAGCGGEAGPSGQPVAKVGPSLRDLTVKAHALLADQCQTVAAGTVYPECDRYTTEVINFANSVKADVSGTAQADAINTSVNKLQTAAADYERRQCGVGTRNQNQSAPATNGPNAEPCTAALTTVRDQVTRISTLLDKASA